MTELGSRQGHLEWSDWNQLSTNCLLRETPFFVSRSVGTRTDSMSPAPVQRLIRCAAKQFTAAYYRSGSLVRPFEARPA